MATLPSSTMSPYSSSSTTSSTSSATPTVAIKRKKKDSDEDITLDEDAPDGISEPYDGLRDEVEDDHTVPSASTVVDEADSSMHPPPRFHAVGTTGKGVLKGMGLSVGDRSSQPMPRRYIPSESLGRMNLAAGVIGILILITVVSLSHPTKHAFPVDVTIGFIARWQQPWEKLVLPLAQLPMAYFGWFALAFSSLISIAVSIVSSCRVSYERNVAMRRNPYRWFDYLITVPLLHLAVAHLNGITDVSVLFLVAFAMVASIAEEWLCEDQNSIRATRSGSNDGDMIVMTASRETKRTLWWMSLTPFMAVWATILSQHILASNDVPTPWWVSLTTWSILGASIAAKFNLYARLRRIGNWHKYAYGECMYIILASGTRITLVILLFLGTESL